MLIFSAKNLLFEFIFFFNDTATTEIYTLSLHDALPIFYEYVIMTNHIHMICLGRDKPLSDILRDFKTFTAKGMIQLIKNNDKESRKKWMLPAFRRHGKENSMNKTYQFWQNMNSPTLLYDNKIIDQKTEYIHQNPVKTGFVEEPFDWYYSIAHPNGPLKTFDF